MGKRGPVPWTYCPDCNCEDCETTRKHHKSLQKEKKESGDGEK